ncbi:MAG: hypothetical protein QXK93_08965 [Candidatus Bathyarchaeia archaeon]
MKALVKSKNSIAIPLKYKVNLDLEINRLEKARIDGRYDKNAIKGLLLYTIA